MKKYIMIILSFFIASGLCTILPGGEQFGIYDEVIRVHVIANSDSTQDQNLKLALRDEAIAAATLLLKDCDNIQEAKSIFSNNLPFIEKSVYDYQKKLGFDYNITAVLCREYYPTRVYDNISLPCGEYNSLQIKIGQAKGKNWWCILYPSLCLTGSAKSSLQRSGMSQSQINIISNDAAPNYKVKFKIVEWFGKLQKFHF